MVMALLWIPSGLVYKPRTCERKGPKSPNI
jgi:hypothetical protein